MKCSTCNFENRAGARFCHQCGAALPESPPAAALPVTKPLPSAPARRSGNTRPLEAQPAAFAALPCGALLDHGRYEVLEVRQQTAQQNIYQVEDGLSVRKCPNCHTLSLQAEELFCVDCGADLSAVPGLHLRYQMYESAVPEAFAGVAALLQMQLRHPALTLPKRVFTETPYGATPRHYLVDEEFLLPLASTLPVPQEPVKVLTWGVALAQGLDYLHRHFVTFPKLALTTITIDDKHASWADWQAAQIIPAEQRGHAQASFAQDIQALARILTYLVSGQQQPERAAALPESAVVILTQAAQSPGALTAAALAVGLEQALETLRRPAGVTLRVGYRTDVGVERSLNEDSLSVLTLAQSLGATGTPVGVYVVADGMGGHDAGELASQLTIQTMAQKSVAELLTPAATRDALPDGRAWLKDAVQAANRTVHEQRKAARTDMGNTCVAAIVIGDKITVANAGDSRAYLLTTNGIEQITVDHSLVERLVATGQITREEAAHHPQKNVIYRVIGDKAQLEVDLFEPRVGLGEALLLCSDGLSGMVQDTDIWQIWHTSTSPQEACDRLVQAANQAGGEDNISVIVVQLTQ